MANSIALANPVSTKATDPPTGESPLASNPYANVQFSDRNQPNFVTAGGQEAATKIAFQDFATQFGRNPTQSELTQLIPAYISGDPNHLNSGGGKANVASYFTQLSNSPTSIYQKQQDQYLSDAPKYADQVNQAFQSNLGRDATDAEKAHFGALMASGQDPYQVQQALQQTTEYNTKQTQDFTKQLGTQLQGTNADYYSKYILPTIQTQNAQAGRTQDSSGYQAQLANAAQGQNYDLQNYLATVSAGAYGNSTQNAANQYSALMNQQYGLQNAGVSNTLANQASNTQYNQNLNMYQMQQQAYNNYLSQYGKRNSGMGGLIGGLAGAGLGAFGGPAGAAAGFNIGSSLGSYAGGGSYGQGAQPPSIGYSGLSSSWGSTPKDSYMGWNV